MKNLGVTYLLAILNFITPFAGIHRFYLGRPISGLLYFLTWGFFGLGTLIDLFLIPGMVEEENRKRLPPGDLHLHFHGRLPDGRLAPQPMAQPRSIPPPQPARALPAPPRPSKPMDIEQRILQIAKDNGGSITVAMIALKTELSLKDAKNKLERLRKDGFCNVDLSEEGAKLYVFTGLQSTKPMNFE